MSDGVPANDAPAPACLRLVRLDTALLRWFGGDGADEAEVSADGRDGFTLSLTTLDGEGWPRTALLGLAEVLAPDPDHLVLALWPTSRGNQCLVAQGRALLSFVFAGRFHQWRLVVRRSATLAFADDGASLACHLVALDGGEAHSVPYATLTSGIRYTLRDAVVTGARWREQTRCMRRFAKGA